MQGWPLTGSHSAAACVGPTTDMLQPPLSPLKVPNIRGPGPPAPSSWEGGEIKKEESVFPHAPF